MRQRQPRQRDEAHCKFIRSLPCIITGENTSVECAHLRFTDLRVDKNNAGVGAKPDDMWTVPLSGAMHRKQHATGNERKFWHQFGIDPIFYAMALYINSGDYERCCRIVMNAAPAELASIMRAG